MLGFNKKIVELREQDKARIAIELILSLDEDILADAIVSSSEGFGTAIIRVIEDRFTNNVDETWTEFGVCREDFHTLSG